MFKKEKIDFIYRLVCLITFCFVIIYSNNVLTLGLLGFFFFMCVKNEGNLLYCILFLLTFIFISFEYLDNSSFYLSKIIIIVSYLYYFLIIPSANKKISQKIDDYLNKKYHLNEEKQLSEDKDNEQEYLRFQKSRKSVLESKGDLPTTIYVTYHLIILFLTILIGGFF